MDAIKLAMIQARMSSSRLPGKVLTEIAGKPLLKLMLERVVKAKSLDGVLVATTTDPSDDVLEQFCRRNNTLCFRGSMPDVLDRVYRAAVKYHADVIVRLTADCPLIDPHLIDMVVSLYFGDSNVKDHSNGSLIANKASLITAPFNFATNRLPPPWKRTIPIGLDVEVCSFESLLRAWKEADQPFQREHVMPYLYEGIAFQESNFATDHEWYIESGVSLHGFKVALLNHNPEYGTQRWTVDTPADLEFIRQVFIRFKDQSDFSWKDVLALLEREPGLTSINADVKHKSAFDIDQRTLNQ
jgi:spore coat polysaccharide biosynthesis protein SpsF